MQSLYYFLHISGVIIWIGSFIGFGILLRSLAKQKTVEQHSLVITKIDKIVKRLIHPSALTVLISGVLLILPYNRESLPLYITLMEQAGSIVILLSIIFLTLQSRKIQKALNGQQVNKKQTLVGATDIYSKFMLSSAFLAGAIVVIVSMKI